jgi:hypothetical protein
LPCCGLRAGGLESSAWIGYNPTQGYAEVAIMARQQKSKEKESRTVKPSAVHKYFSQTEFPQTTLQEAQKLATALMDQFAGDKASPPDVALAVGISPTTRPWINLCGSSIAYGLTKGGVNAATISLTPLGRKLVAPEQEGEDVAARLQAILNPRIMKEFFERYRRAKFPTDEIARNFLRTLGVPQDRLESAPEILKSNGRYAGIIRQTPTGLFVNLDSPALPGPVSTPVTGGEEQGEQVVETAQPETGQEKIPPPPPIKITPVETIRVFISHGKQRGVAAQIKELLVFGNFDPVVSVERESTAIPVPEKVFEDMRSCKAGVINVTSEGNYLDKDGNQHQKINDNVLIEIGAAMALFGKKIVLLVEKGLPLPSNLQGLYRCDYEGDKLDYDATMKLLKTFGQFK